MVVCNECRARMRRGAERSVQLTTLTRNVHKSVDVSNTWRTQQFLRISDYSLSTGSIK